MEQGMKRTPGHGTNDCGVCAVATICGITWEEAAGAIFGPRWTKKRTMSTSTAQVLGGLAKYGWHITTGKMVPYSDHVPGTVSILSVFRRPRGATGKRWEGHWIVRDAIGELIDNEVAIPYRLSDYKPKGEIILRHDAP